MCGGQKLMADVFLPYSPLHLLRQGLSLNLEFPAGQLTLGSTSQVLYYKQAYHICLLLHVGAGDPNSGPYT